MTAIKPDPSKDLLASYVAGFSVSIALTLVAYVLVAYHLLSGTVLILTITALALVQLVVQLRLFLHLGHEPRPRWMLWTFSLMVAIVAILVGGSIWIMYNLNYNMAPVPTDAQILQDEAIGK